MEQIQQIKKKIDSAEDLHSIVKTMKALAAVSIRGFRKAVESLEDYYKTVEMGLQIVMRHSPPRISSHHVKEGKFGAVIFGAERGMSGQFNEKIIDYFFKKMDELEIDKNKLSVLPVGDRIVPRLENENFEVEKNLPLASSVNNIPPILNEMLLRINSWRFEENIGSISLFHNRLVSGAKYEPNYVKLLPLDLNWLKRLGKKEWNSNTLPILTMGWENAYFSMLRNYFFVVLYRAFAESLASENASRLSAMQAAEKNISERLNDLHKEYNHQRQSSITSELMDITSGFEALTKENSN